MTVLQSLSHLPELPLDILPQRMRTWTSLPAMRTTMTALQSLSDLPELPQDILPQRMRMWTSLPATRTTMIVLPDPLPPRRPPLLPVQAQGTALKQLGTAQKLSLHATRMSRSVPLQPLRAQPLSRRARGVRPQERRAERTRPVVLRRCRSNSPLCSSASPKI